MMLKRIGVVGVVLVAALVVSGLAVSSASAVPPLGCYTVSNFVPLKTAGNWMKGESGTCEEELESLTSRWVIAEPKLPIPNTPSLWCAKIDNYAVGTRTATGTFSDEKCTKPSNNGEFIEVLVLPDISITLSGSSYPLHLNYDSTAVVSKLETTSGGLLEGEGLHLLLLIGELTALGTFRADFNAVKEIASGNKCMSEGDQIGTVLTEGSFHVVYTSLTPLRLGILYLPNEVKITCSKVKIVVKGSLIASLNVNSIGTEETELVNLKGKLNKGKISGEQEFTQYWNDNGERQKATLLTNPGNGKFGESNEIVEGEPLLTALCCNMFVITSR